MHHPLEKGFIDARSEEKRLFHQSCKVFFFNQKIDFFDFSIDSAFDFIDYKFYFLKLILAFQNQFKKIDFEGQKSKD